MITVLLTIAVLYLFWAQHGLSKQILELKDQGAPQHNEPGIKTVLPSIDEPTVKASVWPKSEDPTVSEPAPMKVDSPAVETKSATEQPARPNNFVFRAENLQAFSTWFRENWFLGIAALSLALAGVFLVQYGVENGVLTPFWRVMGALALGGALIAVGEVIRRRSGDEADRHTAFLPSTFSGAGLVTLFVAALSARHLYGLIGVEAALVALVMASLLSVILGWFYGPFLAAIGIIGSTAAPFLVGGQSDTPEAFYYYFVLIALVALAVDTLRRWAWISVFGLFAGFVGAWLLYSDTGGDVHLLAFALITAVGAVAIPQRSLLPSHQGATTLGTGLSLVSSRFKSDLAYEFPTRLAAGTFAAATGAALVVAFRDAGPNEIWLSVIALAFLFVAATVWMRRAPALMDLAVVPAFAFLWVILAQGLDHGSLKAEFLAGQLREPESQPPFTVTALALLAVIASALAHWRSLFGRLSKANMVWASGAAFFAPATLVIFEVLWSPSPILGAGYWAAHAMFVAAVMVLFAGHSGRKDGVNHNRAAIYALAAITMISFALVVVLTSAALTISLAVMVLGAVLVDRKFEMPLLSWFVQIGAIVIGWRLVIWPGVDWAKDAPIVEVWAAYGLSAILLGASWYLIDKNRWHAARITVESAVWLVLAVFATTLLLRQFEGDIESHAKISLVISVWLISAIVQLYRMCIAGSPLLIRIVRASLAALFGFITVAGFLFAFILFSPLASDSFLGGGGEVRGPFVFDSLLVAYGLPALILGVGYWALDHLRPWFRKLFLAGSAFFVAVYTTFEIRRFWQGNDLSVRGIMQPELYSYTIAMLLVSVGLLFFAFSRRSLALRRIAMIGIGLTIAKVFLVDMAGLTGLIRVASFLGLGLSLSGLAWIDRAMSARWEKNAPQQ